MNLGFHPDLPMTAIVSVSIVNISLMVIAAFYRGTVAIEGEAASWRVRLGLVCGVFRVMQPGSLLPDAGGVDSWLVPFYSGNSYNHMEGTLSNVGLLLSMATFFFALLARGMRRRSGLWVAVASSYLWYLSGLGAALRSAFSR